MLFLPDVLKELDLVLPLVLVEAFNVLARSTCGVLSPDSSRVVASVMDPARLNDETIFRSVSLVVIVDDLDSNI